MQYISSIVSRNDVTEYKSLNPQSNVVCGSIKEDVKP